MFNTMGDRIKQLRVQAKCSQEEMALKVGISQPTYSRIEMGKYQRLPIALLEKLATALDTSPEILMAMQDGLAHLPEYLQAFVKNPLAAQYIENAYIDMKVDQRAQLAKQQQENRVV